MTKKSKQKVTYRILDKKLSIEHHILLQQLTFRKKSKKDKYSEYHSYFIKLPRAIYDLLSPEDDMVYLKKDKQKIQLLKEEVDKSKKVHIQIDNRSLNNKTEQNRYKLTIPKKFISETSYKRGESYILLKITTKENKAGYEITLKQYDK